MFTRDIFTALKEIRYNEELQLTDGIRLLIRRGIEFTAIRVDEVYDLGNIENYIISMRKIIGLI